MGFGRKLLGAKIQHRMVRLLSKPTWNRHVPYQPRSHGLFSVASPSSLLRRTQKFVYSVSCTEGRSECSLQAQNFHFQLLVLNDCSLGFFR